MLKCLGAVEVVAAIVVTNDFGSGVAGSKAGLMSRQQRRPKSGIGLKNLGRASKLLLGRDNRKYRARQLSISPAAPVLSLQRRSMT